MIVPIPDFSRARVLVVGDVMLDRYWHGSTSRISPEAPVPVVHVKQVTEQAGGAGNVALNISALGAEATLIGMTGDDVAADTVAQLLQQAKVICHLHRLAHVPTITKLRVLSRHQQLIRLDFEEPFETASAVLPQQVQTDLARIDVLVLSDYGKGVLTDPQILIQLARQAGKAVLVDPKGNDFDKYRNATLITPNLSEFETIVGHCRDEQTLVERGENLRADLGLEALLITRSEKGMTLLQAHEPALHLPAQARDVYDVTGAGDTVIGVLSAGLAAGLALTQATALANHAAGLVVSKLGAATVSVAELENALHLTHGHAIQDLQGLEKIVKIARAQGERIVMTNGCFDILHAGHVQYLAQARQLGDRLIVAVNDDASVKRLKGASRPINSLEKRLAVLSALKCVDWVIPFSEDTPETLICQLLPDVLVKGGDYTVAQIAGSRCVLEQGGEVKILSFLEGCSTTATLQALQQ
ncbi:D-heptose-7- phosphate 1-kinase,D-heptose-1-phosphate adenylyltransferase [Beggiatoa alba B18LD]|uniref:Bifunctional protein HldE n=1 Tax=Beggiatoa alba B18LD TaxID=395493 RepID=I3CHA0_9GAMM|nr:bifunctional D-glycero-beta-D-manno-heptose-7-phosphate kinase/D-glycero-beta-D-manno-heptose 1-phosphate adenylyltransferase HldE [Beggiatoa alba]EIJ42993.1 D-heptose-7- phosphate 1-kinase,D-heptose-1-phosphate adenylyltransferase [Beggiatoa alba B18LD]